MLHKHIHTHNTFFLKKYKKPGKYAVEGRSSNVSTVFPWMCWCCGFFFFYFQDICIETHIKQQHHLFSKCSLACTGCILFPSVLESIIHHHWTPKRLPSLHHTESVHHGTSVTSMSTDSCHSQFQLQPGPCSWTPTVTKTDLLGGPGAFRVDSERTKLGRPLLVSLHASGARCQTVNPLPSSIRQRPSGSLLAWLSSRTPLCPHSEFPAGEDLIGSLGETAWRVGRKLLREAWALDLPQLPLTAILTLQAYNEMFAFFLLFKNPSQSYLVKQNKL